ncbi:MAG: hypothetical protein JST43_07285 [Bacteroidetes bacterium]|nr:hypothetical protein [Bacteroidota bacterium]MBS1541794.1 hypothetical protein [Bacteroidota bacterium]
MKKAIRIVIITAGVLAVIFFSLIGSVDDRPLMQQDFYHQTMAGLDVFSPSLSSSPNGWTTAWKSINITPASPMPMAGYAPRSRFESVHDSVYIRLLLISNGYTTVCIISADLLIFPPALKQKISQLNKSNCFLYFSASHVHSSLGAWNDSPLGNFILGSYNDAWLNSLAAHVNEAILQATRQLHPSTIKYFETDASEYVENRIDPLRGSIDGKIRGLKIVRNDSTKALLASYSGHPTNISHLSRAISADYIGAMVHQAEKKDYDFALFAAGMIGSHRTKFTNEKEFVYCDSLGQRLYRKIKSASTQTISTSNISTGQIQVHYGPSQLHILQKLKVRDWVFRWLFQKLEGNITYLKLGNIIMLGMPCDFSGEIFVDDHLGQLAELKDEKLFITSFNGDYVGYITSDKYYGHSEQEEVMALNWVGPHFGKYYSDIVKKVIEK